MFWYLETIFWGYLKTTFNYKSGPFTLFILKEKKDLERAYLLEDKGKKLLKGKFSGKWNNRVWLSWQDLRLLAIYQPIISNASETSGIACAPVLLNIITHFWHCISLSNMRPFFFHYDQSWIDYLTLLKCFLTLGRCCSSVGNYIPRYARGLGFHPQQELGSPPPWEPVKDHSHS